MNIWLQYQRHLYLNDLDDTVNKCNKAYHSAIKMKPDDVKSSTFIDSAKETNENDSKFNVGGHVRLSKYKNIFEKGYALNWTEEQPVTKKSLKWFATDICYHWY